MIVIGVGFVFYLIFILNVKNYILLSNFFYKDIYIIENSEIKNDADLELKIRFINYLN